MQDLNLMRNRNLPDDAILYIIYPPLLPADRCGFFISGRSIVIGEDAGPHPGAQPDAGVHHHRGQLSHGLHVPARERHRLHQVRYLHDTRGRNRIPRVVLIGLLLIVSISPVRALRPP